MASNVTKILIRKFWKRCVTLPSTAHMTGMALPFWCSLSLMTLPSEAPALPPPSIKNVTSLRTGCSLRIGDRRILRLLRIILRLLRRILRLLRRILRSNLMASASFKFRHGALSEYSPVTLHKSPASTILTENPVRGMVN